MLGRLPVAPRLRRCTASPTWTNLTERAAIARSLLMEAEASDLEVYLSVRGKYLSRLLKRLVKCIFWNMFLNGLPTVNRSCVRHINRVFQVERGHGRGIVVVDCLGILLTDRNKLLDYLWIDRVFLLGEGRHSKAPSTVVIRKEFAANRYSIGDGARNRTQNFLEQNSER